MLLGHYLGTIWAILWLYLGTTGPYLGTTWAVLWQYLGATLALLGLYFGTNFDKVSEAIIDNKKLPKNTIKNKKVQKVSETSRQNRKVP